MFKELFKRRFWIIRRNKHSGYISNDNNFDIKWYSGNVFGLIRTWTRAHKFHDSFKDAFLIDNFWEISYVTSDGYFYGTFAFYGKLLRVPFNFIRYLKRGY